MFWRLKAHYNIAWLTITLPPLPHNNTREHILYDGSTFYEKLFNFVQSSIERWLFIDLQTNVGYVESPDFLDWNRRVYCTDVSFHIRRGTYRFLFNDGYVQFDDFISISIRSSTLTYLKLRTRRRKYVTRYK